ncbi:hypothetical protein ACJX0J_004456, partial (mitochondrion) [Zea mays]
IQSKESIHAIIDRYILYIMLEGAKSIGAGAELSHVAPQKMRISIVLFVRITMIFLLTDRKMLLSSSKPIMIATPYGSILVIAGGTHTSSRHSLLTNWVNHFVFANENEYGSKKNYIINQ